MKIQDILFLLVFLYVLWLHKPKVAIIIGLLLLLLSIPLFSLQIFFTAQHLVWYAAAFFLMAIILEILQLRKETK